MAIVARHLGLELMPWQRFVADVAGELITLEDGSRVHAYSTVILGVGRRAGKSALTLAELITVAAARSRRAWYTAQSRADAALTFRDEWVPMVEGSPLGRMIAPRLANGSEGFTLGRLGSRVRVFAPTPTALHGQAGDLIMFDEAWAHTAERGAELTVAARPLMATRPGAQLWILSAAGDIDSSWWAEWVEVGRAAAAADTGRGIAYFEWSADTGELELDLDDPAVWIAAHPAVRTADNPTGTITLEWLEAEHALDPTAFARTYLNITDRAGLVATPIDPTTWAGRSELAEWDRTAGALTAAIDCSPEQSATAIVLAGELEGRVVLELADCRDGIGWVVDRVTELTDRWHLERVALDRAGPAGALWAELELAGVPLFGAETREVAAAAAGLVEALRTDRCRYRPAPELDTAAAAARRRPVGDGSWTFRRVGAAADVAPIVAASLARYVHPAVGSPAPAVF